MVKRSGTSWQRGLWGGVVAGIIAGAVLSAVMAIMNVAQGNDVWAGMKFAGTPFLGERAALSGFDAGAVLVGLLCHFAVSIGWAALFGVLVHGLGRGATVGLGAMYGIVVWLGMFYVVLPIVGMPEVAETMPVGMAVVEHVFFGIVVALAFLPFQRRRAAGYPRPAGAIGV
jgi:hypothetical protein